jgi:hypothetical protein
MGMGVVGHAYHELSLSLLGIGDLLVISACFKLAKLALLAQTKHNAVFNHFAKGGDISFIEFL